MKSWDDLRHTDDPDPAPDGDSAIPGEGGAWQLPTLIGLASILVVVLAFSLFQDPPFSGGGAGPASGDQALAPLASPTVVPLTPVEPAPEKLLVVYVVGEVARPGLVEVKEGARVGDAVARAGGLTSKADTMAINLATRLKDEDKVVIPAVRETPAAEPADDDRPGEASGEDLASEEAQDRPPGAARRAGSRRSGEEPGGVAPLEASMGQGGGTPGGSGKVNVNRATAEELQTLKGVGPGLAAQIVEWRLGPPARTFQSLEELLQVPGIGPSRLEQLRPHVEL